MIMAASFVDREISREKLHREMERWKANSLHQERGWILLGYDEERLLVELAFLAKVAINAGAGPLPVVVCAVRLSYDNYDVWAPSLTFIDVFNRQPARPHVRAIQGTPTGPRDVLIDTHPDTDQPFLCVPGIREYHTHPQHTGDSWLLYRERGEGSISTICDRLWHYMSRNVLGLKLQMQGLPTWPLQAQLSISLAQGDVDLFVAAQQQLLARNVFMEEPGAEVERDENRQLVVPVPFQQSRPS